MFCPNCGTQNADGARFCSACGAPLGAQQQQYRQPQPQYQPQVQQPYAAQPRKKRSPIKRVILVSALLIAGFVAILLIGGVREALGTTKPDWVTGVNVNVEDPGRLYNYLSEDERLFYDTMENLLMGDGSMAGEHLLSEDFDEKLVLRTAVAFINDYPEVGYCGSYAGYYHTDHDFEIRTIRSFQDDLRRMRPVADEVVAGLHGTQSEKVLQINDYLMKHVQYDATTDMCQTTYGALVEGKSVCQGYCGAFGMLCAAAGIRCYTVMGESEDVDHGWNIVRLEDGNWYEIDVTANDNSHSHYYFCVTTSKMENNHTRNELMHGFETIVPVTQER